MKRGSSGTDCKVGWPPPTGPGRTGCSWTRTSMTRSSSQKVLIWKCRANSGTPVCDVIDGA